MEANRGITESMRKGQTITINGTVFLYLALVSTQYLSLPYISVRYIHSIFHPFLKTFLIVSALLRLMFLHFILSVIFQFLLFLHAERPNHMRFGTLTGDDDKGKNKQTKTFKLKASSINSTESCFLQDIGVLAPAHSMESKLQVGQCVWSLDFCHISTSVLQEGLAAMT